MSSALDSLLKDKLSTEQLEVALYIYIGQNIRDEGILKQDSYLKKRDADVRFLLNQEIVEEFRWYKFDVLRISYRYIVQFSKILEEKLKKDNKKLTNELNLIPKNILSFLVYEYMSHSLSFPIVKD